MDGADAARRHWRAGQRLAAGLLLVWFGVTFGVAFFARELNGQLLGWPFSFWVAAQGAPIVYLLLVAGYARWSRRLDDAHGSAEDA
ncbi:MAG TPA: DUF4212 domain-containing protein [Burkholderiaceae bacterium]|nr:DUF4212 domain-containing protein [Burkholderiaceae bacterium]